MPTLPGGSEQSHDKSYTIKLDKGNLVCPPGALIQFRVRCVTRWVDTRYALLDPPDARGETEVGLAHFSYFAFTSCMPDCDLSGLYLG